MLRDAFTSDRLDPAGLYFGTRGGQLFASRDEGESWNSIADWLPAVLCVKAVEVALSTAMIFHLPSALRRFAGERKSSSCGSRSTCA